MVILSAMILLDDKTVTLNVTAAEAKDRHHGCHCEFAGRSDLTDKDEGFMPQKSLIMVMTMLVLAADDRNNQEARLIIMDTNNLKLYFFGRYLSTC